jgi:hypothetical protein
MSKRMLPRPGGALGQAEGGLVQAIGMVLSERRAPARYRLAGRHSRPDPAPKALRENTAPRLPAAIASAVRAATGAAVRAFPRHR